MLFCCCDVVVMLLCSCCDVVIGSLCCCLDGSDKLFSVSLTIKGCVRVSVCVCVCVTSFHHFSNSDVVVLLSTDIILDKN